jgi:hypothetical protein
MTPDGAALAAIVILLFPMGFFLMSSPAFLLVKLDIPEVTQLLRGVFNAYFLMVEIAAVIGIAILAVVGQPALTVAAAAIAASTFWARRWFLARWDAQLRARDAGDATAVRRLRHLHWGGMISNLIQLIVVVSSIPFIATR